jgi:Cu/Ag efflux protein CusF
MNKILKYGALAVLATASLAGAQTKTITGETKTASATVEAIDHARREVTVKKSDGTYDVLYVPEAFAAFDSLKIGDTIRTRYYENLVLRMKPPGEKDVDSSSTDVTRRKGTPVGTGGTAAHQRTITATITAIDRDAPSITFSGPNGWTYSSRVEDKEALSKVKVGDKVDITWTDAVVLSLEQGK